MIQRIRYLDESLDEPAKVIFLGDYVDYGPSPRQVIDLLLQVRDERETVFLCGNHEDLMLQFLEGSNLFRELGNVWFRGNGGQDTVASFTQSPDVFRRVYRTPEEYCRLTPDEFHLAPKYLAFFTGLRYGYTETFEAGNVPVHVAFCHASPFQPSPDPEQPALSDRVTVGEQLALDTYDQFHRFYQEKGMWIEQTHIWNRQAPQGRFDEFFLVQGHTPTCCLNNLGIPVGNYDINSGFPFVSFCRPDVVGRKTPRRLYFEAAMDEVVSVNIDTSAVYGGSLTALGICEESLAMAEMDVIQVRVGGNHRNWTDIDHFVMRFADGVSRSQRRAGADSRLDETGANPIFRG
jgi:hypothetical protein